MSETKLPQGTIASEEFVKSAIESAMVDLKKFILESFTNGVPEPEPPVVKPPCAQGPKINQVTKQGDRLLSVLFHGEEITEAKIEVLSPRGIDIVEKVVSSANNQTLSNDQKVFHPDNNLPLVYLNQEFVPGTRYEVIMQGKNCEGVSSFFLNIP